MVWTIFARSLLGAAIIFAGQFFQARHAAAADVIAVRRFGFIDSLYAR
jgi:hypothetical protein